MPSVESPLRVVPNIARQIADQLKLAVLRLDGEWIAGVKAGKAALRTDREPVHRHKFDRLVDAAFKNSLVLKLQNLRGDKPEHH